MAKHFKIFLFLGVLLLPSLSHAAKPIPLDLSVAPNIELSSFNGRSFHLSDFRGRMIALHFWASWCVPCRIEMPVMEKFINDNPNAVVLPISVDRNPKAAMRFLDQVGVSIPLMFAGKSITDLFQVRAIPTTIILDKDRRLLYKVFGQAPWEAKDFKDLLLGFRPRLP